MKSGSNDPLAACVRRFAKFDFGPYCMMFKGCKGFSTVDQGNPGRSNKEFRFPDWVLYSHFGPLLDAPPPPDWEPNATVTENVLVMSV